MDTSTVVAAAAIVSKKNCSYVVHCDLPFAYFVLFGIANWTIIAVGIVGNLFVVGVIVNTPKMLQVRA